MKIKIKSKHRRGARHLVSCWSPHTCVPARNHTRPAPQAGPGQARPVPSHPIPPQQAAARRGRPADSRGVQWIGATYPPDRHVPVARRTRGRRSLTRGGTAVAPRPVSPRRNTRLQQLCGSSVWVRAPHGSGRARSFVGREREIERRKSAIRRVVSELVDKVKKRLVVLAIKERPRCPQAPQHPHQAVFTSSSTTTITIHNSHQKSPIRSHNRPLLR
jgi:hypothetical protein